jgi:predicted subunit of tRNA(5-methylaminomethyl-2-thiouridylate) methyltransferase
MLDTTCALLYSGGTDSTCVAALLAERFDTLQLLTFYERGTRRSPLPHQNISRLKKHFSRTTFHHHVLSVDHLLQKLSYERYLTGLLRHDLFLLANPGFSSLSWHVRAIVFCMEHEITKISDGLTRELMHFPGHMDVFVQAIRNLYQHFGINYTNPIRTWDTPDDPQFLHRLIVDPHSPHGLPTPSRKTSGTYLYEKGLLPEPSVKGSSLDHAMQHACYPFVLFNLFVFWCYLSRHTYPEYEKRIASLFDEKIARVRVLLEEHKEIGPRSTLSRWIREDRLAHAG